MRAVLAFALAVAAVISIEPSESHAGREQGARYAETGPYRAGVTTLALGDRAVEVWYPASRRAARGEPRDVYHIKDWLPPAIQQVLEDGAREQGLPPSAVDPPFETRARRDVRPSSRGPFPTVLFAHGFASYRSQSSFLTTHLATWGFVVAAPDYLERGLAAQLGSPPAVPLSDVEVSRQTVELLDAENRREGALLGGAVDTRRVAIVGHSAGGGTAIRFAAEPDVVTAVPMAAGARSRDGSEVALPDRPSLWLLGTADGVAEPEGTRAAFERAPTPARLVELGDAGHLAFSDICAIGTTGGGVVAIAQQAGLPVPENLVRLGTDGCGPEALPAREGWPVVNHFVTAHLRWAFDIDRRPVGLNRRAASSFEDVDVEYRRRR